MNAPKRPLSSWISLTSTILALVALGWVLWPLWKHFQQVVLLLANKSFIWSLVLGAFAYSGLTVLLAWAWWWLGGLFERRPAFSHGYSIWARTQVAKYLPGNVFHYVGRQMLGAHIGLAQQTIALAGILEMACLILAACLITSAGMALIPTTFIRPIIWPILGGLLVFGLILWPVCDKWLRGKTVFSRWMHGLPKLTYPAMFHTLLPAFAAYLVFLLGTGAILLYLTKVVRPGAFVHPGEVVRSYALSWMLGTITIGAPGGVGIREAVLTYQLSPVLGASNAALLAVSLRLVTIFGDLLTAVLGWLVPLPGKNLRC